MIGAVNAEGSLLLFSQHYFIQSMVLSQRFQYFISRQSNL